MKCKTENTEKGKAEDRKKEQQSRRKIGILAMSAAVVLIILGSICLLLLPNKADSKGEWRTLSREEATWNTRESLDTSKERFKRYGKLKKNYFSQDRPKGVSVWEKGIPACTLGDMYQSDLCAVITVTAGYEEDKNYFEAEAEQYIYDRTGRYADHLFVKDAPARAMSFFGRIPAEEGQRMAVFLDVDNYGICTGKLIWNYFVSEDGYVVPMTEDYDDGREEDEEYVGMWDYGGYALEDYLAVLQTGYHLQESQERKKWAIYEYLGHALELSAVQKINGPQLVSAWEMIPEETGERKEEGKESNEGKTERFQVIALAEEVWINEVLQQRTGSGSLTLKREGNDYKVLSDTIVWNPIIMENGQAETSEEEQKERLEKLVWKNYEEWKEREKEQSRYERICAIKEVKPVGILSQAKRLPLESATDDGAEESSQVKLTMEYPVYPLETTRIYGFVENTGETDIYYFNQAIDVWKDGLWHRIPYRREVESLKGAEVLARTDDAYMGNLRMWDYDFPQGRYRVVLCYWGEDSSADEKESYYRVCAEFELRADAKLPEFGELGRQSRKEKRAIRDGCVVLQNGTYRNEKQAELFFHKAILGIPSKLRLVDNDEGLIKEFACKRTYQGIYPGIVYTVTIQKGDDRKTVTYPFFDIRIEEGRTAFIFTTYDGVEDSDSIEVSYTARQGENIENLGITWPEGIGVWYPWDSVTVLSQPQGKEAEWFLRLAEQARKKVVLHFDSPKMIVYNQASTGRMHFFYSEAFGEAGWNLYDNQAVSYDSYRTGKQYTLQGEYPVYVFPIGEEDFGVLFQRKDNCCLGRHYRGKDGELLGIVEGSPDEVIRKLREAGEEREQDGL